MLDTETGSVKEQKEVLKGREAEVGKLRELRSDTYHIVSRTAFLLGIQKSVFEDDRGGLEADTFDTLMENKNARIIRNLCITRSAMLRNFHAIVNKMRFEYKSIYSVPDLVPAAPLSALSEDGIDLIRRSYKDLNEYIIEINKQISSRINNCKELFPIWLNWGYLKNVFRMPKGTSAAGIKKARELYRANFQSYPYQVYLNWQVAEEGNILLNDRKFVKLLYKWNKDGFSDEGKMLDVGAGTRDTIEAFFEGCEKAVMMVDCENIDPFALYAAIQNLDEVITSKISKIVLYDGEMTSRAWNYFNSHVNIPVEYLLVTRVSERKSLVDIRLTAGACKEFYQNHADALVIVSSDSDYWGLITAIPECKYLVMVEEAHFSRAMKEALDGEGIPFCYLNEFYNGACDELKHALLRTEIADYLKKEVSCNIYELLDRALEGTWVDMPQTERRQFVERYLRTMHLCISKEGQVSVELK